MWNFFAGTFAVAGLVAATGPILIHLLNRRRFRVVEWAAMDFLREAMQRNRRILQIRDLLLLLLRVLAVVLVGLALARPYFTSASGDLWFRSLWTGLAVVGAFGLAIWAVLSPTRSGALVGGFGSALTALVAFWGISGISARVGNDGHFSSSQPVHAVLVIDNSASMGYEVLDGGNLLGRAKEKALAFVDELPPESRVSVLPLCGSPTSFGFDAHRNREDVREAIERIPVVDRGGDAARVTNVIDLAEQACKQAPELPAKRVVFLSDQQAGNWPADGLGSGSEGLPELQVVQVAPEEPANVWVSDFHVQDGIADTETPAIFVATIRHQGRAPASDVAVSLRVDDAPVSTRVLDLQPEQEAKLRFEYQIDVPTEPGRPSFVAATLSVDVPDARSDGIVSDNVRRLAVPVVAGLPIVFVDTVGEKDEDVESGEIGETLPLRRLLAPIASRDDETRQLVRVRHVTPDEIDRELLADSRLVVLAGLPSPGSPETVELLREYVLQGGQLAIFAGGDFDPTAWTDLAWLDGAGILPAPIDVETVGQSFGEAVDFADLELFRLDFDTMGHEYFRVEDVPLDELGDLYRQPEFVKAVRVRYDDQLLNDSLAKTTKRIEEERTFLAESDGRRATWTERERNGTLTAAEEAERAADEERRKRLEPAWLAWDRERPGERLENLSPAELAQRGRPQLLASFTGERGPFLVSHRVGLGRVQFFSTGLIPEWNTLATTDAMLMFLRIFGSMISDTLPERNFETGQAIVLPARSSETIRYTLLRDRAEDGATDESEAAGEMLIPEAIGREEFGLVVRNALLSGHYVVREEEIDPTSTGGAALNQREIPLAVNGPAEESEVRYLEAADLAERFAEGNYRWIGANEEISLEGAEVRGRDTWKILIVAALACLLIEMLVLATPALRRAVRTGGEGGGPGAEGAG